MCCWPITMKGETMRNFLLLLALLSQSVFAVELDFTFNVNSSGPSIYPCDAGIKHASHSNEICYDRETEKTCDPTLCQDGEVCDCRCTGGNDPDDIDYTQDFLTVAHADWVDSGSPLPQTTAATVIASDTDFSRIFTDKDEWNKQISALTFNLGSERYGTEFYLDVCYRGPQIDYRRNNASNKFRMNLQSTITDLISTNGLKYSEVSDLKVRVEGTCDLQGTGAYSDAASDDALAHQIKGVTGGDKNFSTKDASFKAGANLVLVNEWINNSSNQAPRFCKVRYYFSENMRNNTSNPLSQIRKWQNQQARISTFSDIVSKKEL